MKRVNILMAAAIVFAVGSAFTPKLAKSTIQIRSYKLGTAPGTCVNEDRQENCKETGIEPCIFAVGTDNTLSAYSDINCGTEVFKP